MGAVFRTLLGAGLAVADYPADRGRIAPGVNAIISRQSLPTDPSGVATVTFAGVQAGSEIRVYLPDSTEVAGVEGCPANPTLVWPAYVAGSPNNNVYITIIKRGQRWLRFNYTTTPGAKEIPIFQQPDLGYSNPT